MASIDPADWEARAANIRQSIPADQLSDTSLAMVLNSFLLADDEDRVWAYNGVSWSAWDGQQWTQSTPPSRLELQAFAAPEAGAADDQVTTTTGMASVSGADTTEEPSTRLAGTAEPEPATLAAAEPMPSEEPELMARKPGSPADAESAAGLGAERLAGEPMAEEEEEPRAAAVEPPSATSSNPLGATPAAAQPSPPAASASGQPWPGASAASGPMDTARPAEPAQWPAPQAAPTFQYRPTHAVPPPGIAAWSRPDPTIAPEFRLWAGLDVMVVEWLPSGWARVVTSNQWSGWVDGRMLQPYR